MSRHSLRRAIARGQLERLHGGVYRFTSTTLTWRQRALGALLRFGPKTALSHASAAFVLRLQGFTTPPDDVELLTRHEGKTAVRDRGRNEDVVLHRTRLPFQTLLVDGLRVTDAPRTLLDLGGRLQGVSLDDAVDSAQRRFWELDSRLSMALGVRAIGVKGAGRLRALLEDRGGQCTDSPLEAAVFRALRASPLPRPVHQFEVFDGTGYVTRLDFAWPAERVALHVDGYAYHRQRSRFEQDRVVASRLTALGWCSVWVTHQSLEDPTWLHALGEALAQRARPPAHS